MNALLIDDELPAQKILQSLLQEYCPQVNVIGCASSASEARSMLKQHAVDILFLDVNMPRESGFDLLSSIASFQYAVIFVTGNQEYALRALKASAVDFLLKPVDIDELKTAVKKVVAFQGLRKQDGNINNSYVATVNELSENLLHEKKITRLTLHHLQGFKMVAVNDIVFLEADRNYTVFHLINQERVMVSRTMGEYEDLLDPQFFFRTHKSFIINLSHLKEYSTTDGYFAVMNDGISVIISRRRVDEFMQVVKRFTGLK
ncbi:MAG: LytTR family DNA-binding domain-containing protein [Chitinophagales bacterium]